MNSEMNIELALKYLKGLATDMEKAGFDQWLNSSEENRIRFDELKKYWELTGTVFQSYEPDTTKAWSFVKKQTIDKQPTFKINYLFRIAAILVAVLSISLLVRIYQHSNFHYNNSLITNFSTDTIKEIKLDDGSIIWLNVNSKLEVPKHFGKKFRKVRLNGEAYFEIAHDINRPFIIESKNTTTEVLGTKFNIRAKENEEEIIVTVSSGKVAFYTTDNQAKKVFLTKGMKGIWTEENNEVNSLTEKNLNYLAWKTHVLQFKNAPLTQICQTIGSNYNLQFQIDTSAAEGYLFTGNFNNVNVDQMLDIIATTLDIKFIKSGNHLQVNFK